MKYTCWGASRQVTGSMHLLEFESGFQVLLDCGLDYEHRNGDDINASFPFDPASIDVLILSHAHIDHSGNIPNLIKQGFQGNIICTEPTSYLLDKLWTDSVNIQNHERKRNNNRVRLFGFSEVKKALEQVLTLPYKKEFRLADDLVMSFYEAGHILGAASIRLTYQENGGLKKIGFTGDLGNYGSTLIVDPEAMDELNYLIMESTYGNRYHRVQRSPGEELQEHVINACIKREGGRLIIPAFSVGRTQAILYTLKTLIEEEKIPPIKVFADSPLALSSSNIHFKFRDYLNEEARENFKKTGELFDFKSLLLVEDEEDVETMEFCRDACIIVSSAGMMEGGRILHHLQDHLMNPMCTVLIAGFCSPGTLGAKLLDGINPIRIKNKERYVYAKILQTDVFSAHPDEDGLIKYLERSKVDQLEGLLLVHGVEEAMEVFGEKLKKRFQTPIHIPNKGESFFL